MSMIVKLLTLKKTYNISIACDFTPDFKYFMNKNNKDEYVLRDMETDKYYVPILPSNQDESLYDDMGNFSVLSANALYFAVSFMPKCTFLIYNAKTGEHILKIKEQNLVIETIFFSNKNENIAYICYAYHSLDVALNPLGLPVEKYIKTLDISMPGNPKMLKQEKIQNEYRFVALSPDDKYIVLYYYTEFSFISLEDGKVYKYFYTIKNAEGWADFDRARVKFSPDYKWFAAASEGSLLYIWNIESEQLLYVFPDVATFAFSPKMDSILTFTREPKLNRLMIK